MRFFGHCEFFTMRPLSIQIAHPYIVTGVNNLSSCNRKVCNNGKGGSPLSEFIE